MVTFSLYLVLYLCIGLIVAVVTQVVGADRWFCLFHYEDDAALNMLLWPGLLAVLVFVSMMIVLCKCMRLLGRVVVYLCKRIERLETKQDV